MSPLNADITTESMRLMQFAKAIQGKSIRQIVQDAIDAYLRANGITAEKYLNEKNRK